MTEEQVQELKELMNRLGIQKYKELFDQSLTLLQWCAEETTSGRMIASIDTEQDRFRELAMPIFDRLLKRSAAARLSKGPKFALPTEQVLSTK